MENLTNEEKEYMKNVMRLEFDLAENKEDCQRVIDISEKIGIDTEEMKKDFDFYYNMYYGKKIINILKPTNN